MMLYFSFAILRIILKFPIVTNKQDGQANRRIIRRNTIFGLLELITARRKV